MDQLIIGNKASYDDFCASVKSRKIYDPAKKKITKTVPFSNKTYDFTKINGEIYWDQRKLEYEFEIWADSPEDLEVKKTAFSNFVMNVIEEEIYDPFITGFHFIGTFDNKTYTDDDSVEKTNITVTFLAYPYKVADTAKSYDETIAVDGNVTITVFNDSSHRITPSIIVSQPVRIVYGNASYGADSGTIKDEALAMEIGENSFYIENLGEAACTVTIQFFEEVF